MVDVAPLYGKGESRLGLVLKELSATERDRLIISSKVGDDCPPYSDNGGHSPFSYEGVMASLRHSLQLLRVVCGWTNVDELIQAARPQERVVEEVGPVGCGKHKESLALLHAVKLRKKLRDDPVHHAARIACRAAAWRECVDLIEKKDAWRGIGCLGEKLAHSTL